MTGPGLPARHEQAVGRFVDGLKGIYGDALDSAVLYGSAASGEHSGSRSNLNILLILKDTSIPSLKRCRNFVNRSEFRDIKAIFMTADYISKSIDVFPIEFLDMKDNYRVLSGDDPLKGVAVDLKNLRFQCEHELKARVITLKQHYIGIGNDARGLVELLLKSVTSMTHILRNALRIKGIAAPYDKKEAIAAISKEFGIDRQTWQMLIDAKSGAKKIDRSRAEDLFAAFVGDLEKSAGLIDRI